MGDYAPLWCKSNYSFLEGASHPEELVETAANLGLPAFSLSDRGGQVVEQRAEGVRRLERVLGVGLDRVARLAELGARADARE